MPSMMKFPVEKKLICSSSADSCRNENKLNLLQYRQCINLMLVRYRINHWILEMRPLNCCQELLKPSVTSFWLTRRTETHGALEKRIRDVLKFFSLNAVDSAEILACFE